MGDFPDPYWKDWLVYIVNIDTVVLATHLQLIQSILCIFIYFLYLLLIRDPSGSRIRFFSYESRSDPKTIRRNKHWRNRIFHKQRKIRLTWPDTKFLSHQTCNKKRLETSMYSKNVQKKNNDVRQPVFIILWRTDIHFTIYRQTVEENNSALIKSFNYFFLSFSVSWSPRW